MAWSQQAPQGNGFQQVNPANGGFQMVNDAHNPAAQAYARQALAHNGIHVPPGVDATAVWRDFSLKRAQNQYTTHLNEPAGDGPIDPAIQAGMQGGQPQAAQQDPGPIDAGIQAGMNSPHAALSPLLQAAAQGQLPARHQALNMNGLVANANNQDWRMRIASMANQLQHDPQFQTLQGGPAEAAVSRLLHVHQATHAARAMATQLSARRPSRRIPRGIKAY